MAANLRIAVSYAYVERPNTRRNLDFFLKHGLDESVSLLSIVVKGGRPSDGAGSGGEGFSVDIPEEHRERVRVTFAEENMGYDMESHRRNALLFAEMEEKERHAAEEEGLAAPSSRFTHYVAMNDSAIGPFCTSPRRPSPSQSPPVEKEEEEEEEEGPGPGPGPGPWHRLFAERLTRLHSHPPASFVATIRHFSYFLFFSPCGWRAFSAELRRRELRTYRDAADVEVWLGGQPHDSMYAEAVHWDCPHTPWDVVFVKENRVGAKKTDTVGTSERLCAVTPEELRHAVRAVSTPPVKCPSVRPPVHL